MLGTPGHHGCCMEVRKKRAWILMYWHVFITKTEISSALKKRSRITRSLAQKKMKLTPKETLSFIFLESLVSCHGNEQFVKSVQTYRVPFAWMLAKRKSENLRLRICLKYLRRQKRFSSWFLNIVQSHIPTGFRLVGLCTMSQMLQTRVLNSG